ncbi:MAG: GNAT family acetyltransferase, partial [Lachnospiraceae bacterium]|nr:GNAT family acetyltransferase [Lachnospiraceae bacterium]
YFSLAVKSIKISAKDISNRAKKKLERIGRLDKKENCYTIAAYLIAQLGKNYNENLRKRITGTELLDIAICTLQEIRYALGGMMVYLECEENEFLLNFYEKKNGFYSFSERYVDDDDEMEPHKLIRLMQFL